MDGGAGRLQSMGSLRVGHDWATSLSLFTHWRRKWQPTPVFLPGESQGRGSLVGFRPWGRTVGHDWSDLAAAAAAHTHTQNSFASCVCVCVCVCTLKHSARTVISFISLICLKQGDSYWTKIYCLLIRTHNFKSMTEPPVWYAMLEIISKGTK